MDFGALARDLKERWTYRRDLLREADDRLSIFPRSRRGLRWLWPQLPAVADIELRAPRGLNVIERTAWARDQLAELEEQRIEELQSVLDAEAELDASFIGGELKLFSGGMRIIDRIYLDAPEGHLAEVYWAFLVLDGRQRDAKSFTSALCRVPNAPDSPAARQFVEKVSSLRQETASIRDCEREMNELLYAVYNLSDDERLLVERDCA